MSRAEDVFTTFIPIPEDHEQSAAFRLFYKRYMIRVAKIHTESAEYMEQREVEGNEFQGQGRANAQQLIQTLASPATIATLFGEGATIRLVKRSDAMPIYNDIVEHLQDWARHVERKIHGRDVPTEELALFDGLAAQLYPVARHDIQTTGSDLLLAGVAGIMPMSRLRRGGISRFTREEAQRREAEERGTHEMPEQHKTMADALSYHPTGQRKSKWT